MSCPSCQVGGRRLPSLPLGYVARAKKYFGYNNIKSINVFQQNCTLHPIRLTKMKQGSYRSSLEGKVNDVEN